MAGLLDDPAFVDALGGPDTVKQLQAYLGLIGPQPEDMAKIDRDKWLNLGFGLLQGRKGDEFGAIGRAGMNALQTANQERTQLQAQRGQNLQQAVGLMGMAKQNQTLKQQQMALAAFNAALNGNSGATQPGPAQGFQIPGGAAALMNGAASGNEPTATGLPTQVPASPSNQRDQLANAAMLLHLAGGPDMSGSLKFKFPDPVALRAGADVQDPASGQIMPGAPPVPGYYWDRQKREYVKATGGAQAEAEAAAIPAVVKRFTEPQAGVIPGAGEGIVGTVGGSMYGNGPLPYNVPRPYQQQAPQPSGPPAASKPVQTKLSPEQEAESKSLGEEGAAYRTAIAQSSKAQGELGLMKQSINEFTPGPSLPFRAGIAGYAQEIPGVGRSLADALVPHSATALPAIAALEKQAVGLTAEQSKVFGSREGQQVIGMIKSANANAGMVPGAPEVLLDAQMAMHQYIIDKGKAALEWKRDPANHNSLDGFAETWDDAHPLKSYIPNMPALKNIADGKPPGAARNDSAATSTTAAAPDYAIAPVARGNVTVQQVLKNGTPEQKAKLAAKGYLVPQ